MMNYAYSGIETGYQAGGNGEETEIHMTGASTNPKKLTLKNKP